LKLIQERLAVAFVVAIAGFANMLRVFAVDAPEVEATDDAERCSP